MASSTAQAPVEADGIQVTVRYFAAARAAAGAESETLVVRPGTTVAELVERLAVRGSAPRHRVEPMLLPVRRHRRSRRNHTVTVR